MHTIEQFLRMGLALAPKPEAAKTFKTAVTLIAAPLVKRLINADQSEQAEMGQSGYLMLGALSKLAFARAISVDQLFRISVNSAYSDQTCL